MEHLSRPVPESERSNEREHSHVPDGTRQTPFQRHIEYLEKKRDTAPLYPQPIEAAPRFTGPEVAAFADGVGPFFDVVFPEYSLGTSHTEIRYGVSADPSVFKEAYDRTKPWPEKALDKVEDFIIATGMVGLALATELHRELKDVEIPQY